VRIYSQYLEAAVLGAFSDYFLIGSTVLSVKTGKITFPTIPPVAEAGVLNK
jgi:hypothetical protein